MKKAEDFAAPGANSMVDLVYQRIKREIVEDILRPGEKLRMNDLCDRYGVSQTPIKQALNRLMAEGLVEGIPRKGCKVRRATWREIDEVLELRLMMELHFVAAAAQSVGASTLLQAKFEANLEQSLALVKQFQTPEEYFHIYEMDQAFHELLIAAAGNQTALRTYRSLNTHSYAAYLFDKQPRQKTVEGIEEHGAIYRAMLDGAVDEARRWVALHNENARAKIQLTLKVGSLI